MKSGSCGRYCRKRPPTHPFFSSHENDCVLLTCNRDDFLQLAKHKPHHGIIIVVRRRTRAAERAALFRLLNGAGETGLKTTSTSPESPQMINKRNGSRAGNRLRKRGMTRRELIG